ncbi:MAG: formyltransferase, partial [Desulfobulbaceae bacterium]|nr:formyltransferase [Desulfobulbaceae bacterium]
MKAIVLAYHNIGCAGIRALLRNGFEIAAVFTHNDDPKEKIWFESVARLAAAHDIPVYAPEDINHPIWVQRMKEMNPDVLFSFYYRNMVGSPILAIPPGGCLNLHGSLLPAYRGRCPINWVLVNGEKETGVTLHYMTPRPDDGEIVCQRRIVIDRNDTAKALHEKAADATSEMLDEILPQIANGSAPRQPQDPAKASYYGGRGPADGEIDWFGNSEQVRNLVRAVTEPFPGA